MVQLPSKLHVPYTHSHWILTRLISKRKLSIPKDESCCLVSLVKAKLCYPAADKRTILGPLHLSIQSPSTGGHVLLGKNASGKSLVAYALASTVETTQGDGVSTNYFQSGSYETEDNWHRRSVAKVSFQSHEQLLRKGGTVSKAISDGGNLSKAAQFLIVRFGLYHHLHREVNTLSTGEIRKVMLIKALATRPRLLILDNAFDGLDVESRETLKDLVSRTIQGFRPDILVQAVSAKATSHTQVLLLTHRAEEIVDNIQHVSVLRGNHLVTSPRQRRSGERILQEALDLEEVKVSAKSLTHPTLPSLEQVRDYWRGAEGERKDEIVKADRLHYEKGDAVLINRLDWSVRRGERWLIAGRNGAGKSTLGRLLARDDVDVSIDSLSVLMNENRSDDRRKGVGWCSTELHMKHSLDKSSRTVLDVFEREGCTPEMMHTALSWLGFQDASFPNKSFTELSQGQQKLVLIGSAIASRPELLVFDEITQGLDAVNRNLVLNLLEILCEATDITLIYITHHLEEIIPSITHILHFVRGESAYCGPYEGYDAKTVKSLEINND